MVLTSNESYFNRANKVKNLFFDSERKYIHEEFGSNFRMTNMQAAIGLAQLEQIEKTVIRKREIGHIYQEELSGISALQLPVEKTEYSDNIYWIFGLVIKDAEISVDTIMKKLGERGIGTRHFFYPIHKQPALIKERCCPTAYLEDSQFANANYISEHGFYIPSGLGISYEDQKYVIKVLKKMFE
ncbi:GDP-perosamine synthase [bioreactor metagenome]|uniref:GDP-perosamine synthase n=1 Tax=bioreactor metagenome TaxID=1076179 RepID=A0A645EL84_9ZZZZ